MKILTFSSLYPNSAIPRHGIFVENRLRHLLELSEIQSTVIAPIPWFPLKTKIFGEYSRYATVPRHETRFGIKIEHPRYTVIPKIGMNFSPNFMIGSALKTIQRLLQDGYNFDLIDAHYFYPDGVAAAKIAEILDKPLVITARGTDLNLIPAYTYPRKMIKWAAMKANAVVTVCQALKDVLIEMEVPEYKIKVLRNGVDLKLFKPPDNRQKHREKLQLNGVILLSVGHLIKRKGHDLIIKALRHLPGTTLLIAGDGQEYQNLKKLSVTECVNERVVFLGEIAHEKLKEYYGAADALVLASSREGWANVLLESMACGTPVVATDIWGTPEVVASKEAGVLVKRDVGSITNGIIELLENYPDRNMTRHYAEQFSWDSTTTGLMELFQEVINRR